MEETKELDSRIGGRKWSLSFRMKNYSFHNTPMGISVGCSIHYYINVLSKNTRFGWHIEKIMIL